MFVYSDDLYSTLVDILRLPSTSGHEEYVRRYLEHRLATLGLTTQIDEAGNLIASIDGQGEPLLLNAHMDRVAPGLGHEPILREGVLYSDGTTNLGADNGAGIAVIIEVVRRMIEQNLPHPPLVLVFTTREEIGLIGAHQFDPQPWNVKTGIVFDNAFECGAVVSQAASYEMFDIKLRGRTGHSGKDITRTINALTMFCSTRYPHGSFSGDLTRINIGHVVAGISRNAIPGHVEIEGEIRSFEAQEIRERYKQAIRRAFIESAERVGGQAEINFELCAESYAVSPDEPIILTYQAALAQRGAQLQMHPTFVIGDTNAFRPRIRTITISTGVKDEHSTEESIALSPLEQLITDTLFVLHLWRDRSQPLKF